MEERDAGMRMAGASMENKCNQTFCFCSFSCLSTHIHTRLPLDTNMLRYMLSSPHGRKLDSFPHKRQKQKETHKLALLQTTHTIYEYHAMPCLQRQKGHFELADLFRFDFSARRPKSWCFPLAMKKTCHVSHQTSCCFSFSPPKYLWLPLKLHVLWSS